MNSCNVYKMERETFRNNIWFKEQGDISPVLEEVKLFKLDLKRLNVSQFLSEELSCLIKVLGQNEWV